MELFKPLLFALTLVPVAAYAKDGSPLPTPNQSSQKANPLLNSTETPKNLKKRAQQKSLGGIRTPDRKSPYDPDLPQHPSPEERRD